MVEEVKKAEHADLEAVMTEGRPVFSGTAADEPEIPVIIGPVPVKVVEEEVVPVVEPVVEELETKPDFRFKTHFEAEKGYKNIQAEKTRAEQEKKIIETELAALKFKDIERMQTEATVETDKTFLEYAITRHEDALAAIDLLDPDDKEYRKKAAEIWAAKDADIYKKGRELAPIISPESRISPVVEPGPAVFQEEEVVQTRKTINEFIIKEGLKENDPVFWSYATDTPDKDENGNAIELEDQIKWALKQTNNYRASILEEGEALRIAKANEKGEKEKLRLVPMGVGSGKTIPGGKGEAELVKPISMSDAIDFAMEQRRL